MRSCASADVSDFKYKDVIMFLLKLGPELKNLVKKSNKQWKDEQNIDWNSTKENFHEVECTGVASWLGWS